MIGADEQHIDHRTISLVGKATIDRPANTVSELLTLVTHLVDESVLAVETCAPEVGELCAQPLGLRRLSRIVQHDFETTVYLLPRGTRPPSLQLQLLLELH